MVAPGQTSPSGAKSIISAFKLSTKTIATMSPAKYWRGTLRGGIEAPAPSVENFWLRKCRHLACECPIQLAPCTCCKKWIRSSEKAVFFQGSIKQCAAVSTRFGFTRTPEHLNAVL